MQRGSLSGLCFWQVLTAWGPGLLLVSGPAGCEEIEQLEAELLTLNVQ